MNGTKVWVNGTLYDERDAAVPVLDHGFTVGDGVFETLKVRDGVPFALTRHLARLGRSAAGMGLPTPDPDLVRRSCSEVVAANALPGTSRLRITYTGGTAPLGSDRSDTRPTLVVAVGSSTPRPPTTAVVTVPWTRNHNAPTTGLKTTSYADNVVMLARAHQAGASEALFANTAGALCEGTGTNVFVGVGGRLLTPPLTVGCLAGVTRGLLLEWADADEAELPLSVLYEADEVLLTSSLRDVQAVSRIDSRELTAPGPLTRRAAAVFAANAATTPDP